MFPCLPAAAEAAGRFLPAARNRRLALSQASIGDPSQSEASAQPEIPAQNGDVSINLPGDFFESDPDFDPSAYAQKQGFIGAAVNEDGSVTVTMTKERQQELLTDLREEIENAFEELAGGSATPM